AHLAIVDDVDAGFDLAADGILDRLDDLGFERLGRHVLALLGGDHHLGEVVRTRQAAGMGGEEIFGAVHRDLARVLLSYSGAVCLYGCGGGSNPMGIPGPTDIRYLWPPPHPRPLSHEGRGVRRSR